MQATLNEVPVGKRVVVREMRGGIQFGLRLSKMGIFKDSELIVKRNGIFSGPVVVESMGREVALGRKIAERIVVEVIQ
jgi:Fe2+ transport system protein FeoA